MAVPTSYTEAELITYMDGVIGTTSNYLSFTSGAPPTSYDEAFNNVQLAFPFTDIATVTGQENIALLRAYARYFVWELVANNTVIEFDYRHADSQADYKRSQIFKQANKMIDIARRDLEALGGDVSGYDVGYLSVEYTEDLYTASDSNGQNEWDRING